VRVVVAGGGTAGHVFPAIAIADQLSERGSSVRFIGSPGGQEAHLVPDAGYDFHPVRADPMPRSLSVEAAKAPIVAVGSVRACLPLVRGADVVLGMGGYVSASTVLAARRAKIPILLHEQNAVPGLANRLLAGMADGIAVCFEDARGRFRSRAPVTVTGNPVRRAILEVRDRHDVLRKEALAAFELDGDRTTVLVVGGSQGALHIDEAVAGSLQSLAGRADLQMMVLTGPSHGAVVDRPAQTGTSLLVRVIPFLDRMELAYAVADLALARSGATSISELAACGVPSILVPYPHATGNHQEANARELERFGAASVILDRALTSDVFADQIVALAGDYARRQRMSERSKAWAKPDAAARVAELLEAVAK
jgi:UDP-N-acetylglucosamine--N-acetylmuramyl-(pentapeptide) pyrophosphoryl-undecaprenol N-acetylglucosamine transferase